MLSADNGAINTLPTVYICELGCFLVNRIEPFSLKWQVLGILTPFWRRGGEYSFIYCLGGFVFGLVHIPSLNFRK